MAYSVLISHSILFHRAAGDPKLVQLRIRDVASMCSLFTSGQTDMTVEVEEEDQLGNPIATYYSRARVNSVEVPGLPSSTCDWSN